tara:strand:+ start:1093 stop:1893 length:801 start_codon:yes stop_codon:yes gene_type:complete
MFKKLTTVLSVLCFSAFAFADGAEGDIKISGEVILDIVSEYNFRGVNQEDEGLIVQPAVDLDIGLTETFSIVVGAWGSVHGEETGSDNGWDELYEVDYYIGAQLQVKDIALGLAYKWYTSPNDAFNTVEEVALVATYNDSKHWENGFSGLQPHISIAIETENATDGGDEGVFLEIGISPTLPLVNIADRDVTLSVPVTLGFSLDEYYAISDDDGLGYVEVSTIVNVPLVGNWTLHAGPVFLWLIDDIDQSNDNFEVIGKIGASLSF